MTAANDCADNNRAGAGLSGLAHTEDSSEVIARYDGWAASYNQDLASWGYDVPQRLADRLTTLLGESFASEPILDAGCGTGLVGMALARAGFESIVGIDASEDSLLAARSAGVYDRLVQGDLLAPLSFADGTFGAAVCGGVLTYLPDTEQVLTELVRVTKPGGVVLASQRTDLWAERNCDEVMANLEARPGLGVSWSTPQSYLPGHPEYGETIKVIYVTISSQ